MILKRLRKNKKYINLKCPCCGYEKIKVLGSILNTVYSYVSCIKCRHVFTDPMPTFEQTNAYYQGFNFNKPSDKNFIKQKEEIEIGATKIVKDIEAYQTEIPKNMLDFGGGLGFYANGFAKLGIEATLCDIDDDALSYAKEKSPNISIKTTVEELSLPNTYDFIFCNQVLEHVDDIDEFMKKLLDKLNSNGIAIITTPNQGTKEYFIRHHWLKYYMHKVFDKAKSISKLIYFINNTWLCCDPPRHLHAFNTKSIYKFLKRYAVNVLNIKALCLVNDYYSSLPTSNFYDDNSYLSKALHLFSFIDFNKKYGNTLIVFIRKN